MKFLQVRDSQYACLVVFIFLRRAVSDYQVLMNKSIARVISYMWMSSQREGV